MNYHDKRQEALNVCQHISYCVAYKLLKVDTYEYLNEKKKYFDQVV
jgi:hypothetical protein